MEEDEQEKERERKKERKALRKKERKEEEKHSVFPVGVATKILKILFWLSRKSRSEGPVYKLNTQASELWVIVCFLCITGKRNFPVIQDAHEWLTRNYSLSKTTHLNVANITLQGVSRADET